MASLTITVTRADHLQNFPEIFADEGKRFMTVAVEKILSTWQANSPVDTGAYRASETAGVEQTGPAIITGTVSSPLAYAMVIEEGRRAGARQPPSGALMSWVARKFGLTDPRQIRSAAFLVARSIARRGIPAKKPLARAVEANTAFLSQLFGTDFAAAVARRL